MSVSSFQKLLEPITAFVAGQTLDASLAAKLRLQFPPDGAVFGAVELACHDAIAAGWMCSQGAPGRRFGRVIEPAAGTANLSVDVVDLENIVGPHHRHPRGEICMVMPVSEGARFDGFDRGWCVFEPDSDHCPTVTDGEALVLYFLPDGKIDFTEQSAP